MIRFLLSVLLLPAFLLCDWDEMFRGEGDPCIAHNVNVITGNLQLFSEDAVVDGAVPIHLVRTYSSAGAKERVEKKKLDLSKIDLVWQMEGGWSFLPHLQMIVDPRISGYSGLKVYLREPSGEMITYKALPHKEKGKQTLKPERKAGLGFGVISGRHNPNNNVLYVNYKDGTALVECADGGRRLYEGDVRSFKDSLIDHVDDSMHPFERNLRNYLLQEEISPSGQITRYTYGEHSIKITQLNPSGTKIYAWVLIEELHHKPPFSIRITTSDNREIRYEGWSFKNQDYLNFVANGTTILHEISYTKTRSGQGASLRQLNSWGDEEMYVKYYKPTNIEEDEKWEKNLYKKTFKIDKVREINRLGTVIASFSYTPETTDVRDCNNILTRYHHEDNQLFLIEYFDENEEIYSSERFIWQDMNLIAKMMCNKEGNPVFSKTLRYDSYGNIVSECLFGNFSGSKKGPFIANELGSLIGAEQYIKRYNYDPNSHLIIEEREHNGLTHRYTYLDGTDLVLTKSTYDLEKLLFIQTFTYDDDNLLISEVTDDGTFTLEKLYVRDSVTGRIISSEDPLSKIEYYYSPHNQIAKEVIFDATRELVYSIDYLYNRQGYLISKSTPLGNFNTYVYTASGCLLSKKEPNGSETKYTYDKFRRPISCSVNNNQSYTSYNKKGLISSKTDIYGNITEYQYDPFDRCILTIFPEVLSETGDLYHPTMECEYDLLGNPILCRNSKGEVKQTSYNVLSKPTLEIFPGGSKVKHIYNVAGCLIETVAQNNSYTLYTYDVLGRMLSKSSSLFKEKWIYSPSHLLSYTDPTGLITSFTYDIYGRKIEDATLDRKTTYSYDRLNFIDSKTCESLTTTQIHDFEGKVISENHCGENLTRYIYDIENNITVIQKQTSAGIAADYIQYNLDGNIISHKDPFGALTQYFYEDQTKRIVDPLGNTLIETYDALQRLVQTERKSPSGMTVSLEENFYDKSGNLARKVSHIYQNGTFERTSEINWEYDFRGLVVKESQLDKSTYNEYDLLGRLVKKTLPNGITLLHCYDQENRLSKLKSSDGSIDYSYSYELSLNPIQIDDEIHHATLRRNYNPYGELISETNSEKLALSWEYDSLGRKKSLALPDASKITYQYIGNHMKKIERYSKKGALLYCHTYTDFDENGHVHKESLIHSLGEITTDHDLLERPYSIKSPLHTALTTYGISGLVISDINSLFPNKKYEYDPLKQLTKENNLDYHFDSIGNNSDLDINDYSELTKTFIYDKNGNPIKQIQDSIEYKYDALGRLTHITDAQNKTIEFTYDAYSRLSTKTINGKKIFYLYDGEHEIGTLKKDGTIIDLKVLGLGINEDIGAAIAIEIEGESYAPVHDFHGNIIALISDCGFVEATYDYDAFGRETYNFESNLVLNPWRFSSKRKEEGFLYFGRRFYDPEYGRWLTPDPLGFFESSNPYLYTLNSPLNRLDLFGLYSLPEPGFYFEPSKSQFKSSPIYKCPPIVLITTGILSKCPLVSPVDCIAISGHFYKMHFNPIEKITNRANLLHHMDKITSKDPGIIGLITGNNGINTSFDDFLENSQSLMKNVHEETTYIGLHNRSEGLKIDGTRAYDEVKNKTLTAKALQTGRFLGVIADSLGNIQSESYWLHVPHSEAGVLFNIGYTILSDTQKSLLKNQLIVFAVAPAEPISWQKCFQADNIYSTLDWITAPFGKKYKNNPDYNISFIKCESPRRERVGYIADHCFTGTTYRNATTRQIKDLRREYGFYDSKKR